MGGNRGSNNCIQIYMKDKTVMIRVKRSIRNKLKIKAAKLEKTIQGLVEE